MARVAVGSPVHLGGGRDGVLRSPSTTLTSALAGSPALVASRGRSHPVRRPRQCDDGPLHTRRTASGGFFSDGEPAGERLSFLVHQAHPPRPTRRPWPGAWSIPARHGRHEQVAPESGPAAVCARRGLVAVLEETRS